MKIQFYDVHTHRDAVGTDVFFIRNLHQRERDERSPADFAACSVGLHPWFLNEKNEQSDLDWLTEILRAPNVLALGEAGLDRAIATPGMDFQEKIFLKQAELAEALGKPMILHCVRAHDRIIQLKKALRPRQPWIFHGFDKHSQTAKSALDAGCFLSFGAAIFRGNSHAAESLRQTPDDRFFLETDDKTLTIREVYERAAEIRGIRLEDLQAQIEQNFKRVF